MATVPKTYLTEAEYLARERAADLKSEFYRGEVFAMAGGSKEHDRIGENVRGLLWQAFEGKPCEEFSHDMRVRVPSGLYTYPDASAVCREPEFLDDEVDTLLNPELIVEVLSESTESYDRGKKFDQYRGIASLREYLLIDQDRPHAELFRRGEDGRWEFQPFDGLEAVIELASVGCQLPLARVFAKVTFPDVERT